MVWGQKILFEGGFYRGLEVFSFQMRQGSFKVLGFGMCFLHFGPEGLLGGSWIPRVSEYQDLECRARV